MAMLSFAALGTVVFAAAQPGPLPGPEAVRNAAREVLARPEFQIDGSTKTEGLWNFLWRLFWRAVDTFGDFFDWLMKMSPVLAWLFIAALVITLVVLVVHILWTTVMFFRRDRRAPSLADALSLKKVNPADLARQAEAARAGGDYILGVRLLFRASLALLEQREGKTFRLGATNREHLNRYRQTPLYDWLARFVWVIDLKWYGDETCQPADFAACHEAYERICSMAAGIENAQHA
jgi:uncharacterized protein DUF4129